MTASTHVFLHRNRFRLHNNHSLIVGAAREHRLDNVDTTIKSSRSRHDARPFVTVRSILLSSRGEPKRRPYSNLVPRSVLLFFVSTIAGSQSTSIAISCRQQD